MIVLCFLSSSIIFIVNGSALTSFCLKKIRFLIAFLRISCFFCFKSLVVRSSAVLLCKINTKKLQEGMYKLLVK